MAALVCDLCGGKLIMGAGGIATCDSCGMEHSADRMKEKVQEIKGVVQVDNTHLIDNYMRMAQNAYNSNNKEEAENYCNKIIEIDPTHQQAWFLKGRAAGWQSTLSNIRFSEAINCFANAIEYTDEEEKETVIDECQQEVKELAEALLRLRGERFAKWPDEEEKAGFINDLTAVLQAILQFFETVGSLINKDELMAPLATIINNSVMNAWNNEVRPTFANDHDGYPDDYELKKLIDRAGHCTDLLEQAIDLSDADDEGDVQRYKNLIAIHEYLINASSYSYETVHTGYSWVDGSSMYENKYVKSKSLTEEAKRQRRQLISTYQSKIKSIESAAAARKAAEKAAKERAAREAAQARREAYWEKHIEEKNALEAEKKELTAQIDSINTAANDQVSALNKEKNAIPGATEISNFDERIKKLTGEKNALGIFKGKEKKAIQVQIDQAEADKRSVQNRMAAAKKEIENKISSIRSEAQRKVSSLQSRISTINNELTKERSCIGLTPATLKSMIAQKLPNHILTGDAKNKNAGFVQDKDDARQWKLMATKQNGSELKVDGIWIDCAANSVNDDVESIQFECNEEAASKQTLIDLIKMTIDTITETSTPVSTISQLFERNEETEIVIGNVKVSYKESINVLPILNMRIVRYIVKIY